MEPMRVKARVVGNTLVVEKGVPLPEGTEVDVVLRAVGDVDSQQWDVSDEGWAELQAANGRGRDAGRNSGRSRPR